MTDNQNKKENDEMSSDVFQSAAATSVISPEVNLDNNIVPSTIVSAPSAQNLSHSLSGLPLLPI